jgi:hypothetical protein
MIIWFLELGCHLNFVVTTQKNIVDNSTSTKNNSNTQGMNSKSFIHEGPINNTWFKIFKIGEQFQMNFSSIIQKQ